MEPKIKRGLHGLCEEDLMRTLSIFALAALLAVGGGLEAQGRPSGTISRPSLNNDCCTNCSDANSCSGIHPHY